MVGYYIVLTITHLHRRIISTNYKRSDIFPLPIFQLMRMKKSDIAKEPVGFSHKVGEVVWSYHSSVRLPLLSLF